MERFVMMTPLSNIDDTKAIIDPKQIKTFIIDSSCKFTIKRNLQTIEVFIAEISEKDVFIKEGEPYRLLCNIKRSKSLKVVDHKKASGISLAFFI